MHLRLTALAVLLLVFSANAQVQTRSVSVNGATRTFLLYVPPSYSAATPAPVVMNLHGWGDYAQSYMNYGDMRPQSDAAGFLLAYPQASIGPAGVPEWDSAGPYAWGGDEVAFFPPVTGG